MKKILALIIAVFCLSSVFAFSACNNGGETSGEKSKCAVCKEFGDEIAYKEVNGVINIGYACVKCGYVNDPQQTINADYVVSKANDVTVAQDDADKKEKDCVILLKAGTYDTVYFTARYYGATHLIFETGVQVKSVMVEGDVYDVTLENAHFYSEPSGASGGVSFGSSGAVDDSGVRSYIKVTIKNCTFYGNNGISRSWAPGIVEDLTIEGCTFTNSSNNDRSAFTPIFFSEVYGDTVIRNNVFDGADYGMIRIGYKYGVLASGKMIIENNIFKGKTDTRAAVITLRALGDFEVNIRNNIFYEDGKVISFGYGTDAYKESIFCHVGANKWSVIPDTITNATTYDLYEQDTI